MTTPAFDSFREAIRTASLEALPALIGQLEEAKAVAWVRLIMQSIPQAEPKEEERFLTPVEAAAIAQVSKRICGWAHGQRWAMRCLVSSRLLLGRESFVEALLC